jgi:uncharacterized protein CbrC (UPF0167 family)
MDLPSFVYHPDPISTGSVKASTAVCVCCQKARGFVYTASVYGNQRLIGSLCPWCIANGEAAVRFNCFFSDEDPLSRAEVPRQIVIEVTRRTPGYNSWQQEVWQACCHDACVFRGDATVAELTALQGEALVELQLDWPISPSRWLSFLKGYVPGGGMAVYRFDCRHCGKTKYALDLS